MNLLIALFALACFVWIVPVLRSGRMFVVAMLVLLTGTVVGPEFFAINGPIQFSIDRILWFGLFGMAAIGWRLGQVKLPRLRRTDWLVTGIVGWFFVSALQGGEVPGGSSPVAQWLFYIAMPAGMYAIARLVEIRQRDIRYLMIGAIALSIFLAVTAIFEVFGFHALVFPRYIVNAEVWEFYGRGRGPLMNPSANGMLMSVGLVASALGFLYAGRRGKLAYATVAAIISLGVYATLTRSAWLGAVAAIGLVIMTYSPRWVRVLGLMSVILIGGASIAGLKDQLVRMKRDKNLTAADAEKSMALRPLLAVVAWEMFKDRPIAGHGYGHYFAYNDPYHSDRSYELPLEQARPYNQHNVFLSVLVDTGLIGFSMFTAFLAILVGTSWSLAREHRSKPEVRWVGLMWLGTMAAYFCNGMFQDVMIIPMVHMFLFFAAGVAVTIRQKGIAVEVPAEAIGQAPLTRHASTGLADLYRPPEVQPAATR